MALTKAPLFGLDASGTIAGAIVFSKWKGRNYVRRHAVPSNPKTGLQVGMRAAFKYISQSYSTLSDAAKAAWKDVADKTQITPLNAQMAMSQQNIRLGLGVIHSPLDAAGTTPNAPITGVATAAPKTLILTWANPATNPGEYTTMIWMSKTTGFTPSTATLIAVIGVGTLTYTVRDLETGVPYYFRNAECNKNGEVGALQAQWTGTPT